MNKWLSLLCLLGCIPALVFANGAKAPSKAPAKAPTKRVAAKAPAKAAAKAPTKAAAKAPAKAAAKAPATRRAAAKAPAKVAARPAPRLTPLYNMDSPEYPAPAANTTLGRVLKTQTLRVCVRTDVPPFGYFSNTGLTGFDVDLAKELAIQLSVFYKKNLHVSWITINAGARISSLQNNHCDVVAAAFSYTKARAKLITFSRRYIKTDKVIVANANITRKNPIIALVRGTTNAVKSLKGTVRRFNNYKEIIFAMESGEIDYVVTDRPIALHMIRSVTRSYKIVKALPKSEEYALGMNSASKALKKAINLALKALAQRGRLAYLHRQWL